LILHITSEEMIKKIDKKGSPSEILMRREQTLELLPPEEKKRFHKLNINVDQSAF